MPNPFQSSQPFLGRVRAPQRETFQALLDYASHPADSEREVGIILPVGCGKSGCITLAPFAFRSKRTLVVAPGLNIARQLAADFDPSNPNMFYRKCGVLVAPPFPEPVEIRGTSTNRADIDEAHVVITNIQQVQGEENKWMKDLPPDYFDLILFDEGHHSVADSFEMLKSRFPHARVVNFSATPQRADGQIMAGKVLYTFPIFRAIQAGYVKKLKAKQLNPRTLKYVRREDGAEIEVDLEEVKRLGEQDADFRRSIVTSAETLSTLVDASIRELNQLRASTGESRLKIIASALNFQHCHQVVEAYRSRGLRADLVHSKADAAANQAAMDRLAAHELDVIVQVRKLGEGFDHKYLSVAAVLSVFSNLAPFVQFVGRIMRVIEQNNPNAPVNQGVVIFHAGTNIARQWSDFQDFSEADQAYFDQLLPLEGCDAFTGEVSREFSPMGPDRDQTEVSEQSEVDVEEIALLPGDEAAAVNLLLERGKISAAQAEVLLQPIPPTKVAQRQAMRSRLDGAIMTAAGRILARRNIDPSGRELDQATFTKTNLIVVKSAIDRAVNAALGRPSGQRHEVTRQELDRIESEFHVLVAEVEREVFGAIEASV